jgi:hypothetical protein
MLNQRLQTYWALDEARLRAHGIVVARAREGTPELGDLARLLVDRDDITRLHLLLGQRVDHLGAEVVDRLHFGRAQRQAAHLVTGATRRRVHLDFHHFSLDDLRLLHDTHTDGPFIDPVVPSDTRRGYDRMTDSLTHRRNACVSASVLLISSENT